jgi:peptidoglycan/LPS O-acetylase OafA/YrhL
MTYRPDIDGLRAIAVLLVLIYHGGLSLFPSGFIGVDIFFVISGFLITGIINEACEQQRFSFIDFYNRRLWRLQPVFIIFLLMSVLSTLLLFLPNDLIDFSRSARKSSLFIANRYFNQTTTGYFSPDVMQLPLLHTWSLSIEWQCYFIFPVAMYLLHKLCNRTLLLILVSALMLSCVGYSLHASQAIPAQTYYQFSSRIFEFLIGALVALIPLRKLTTSPFIPNSLGFASLISIFYVASLDHILTGYPNYYALLVCSSTALLIAIGTFTPGQKITRMLTIRPLVFVGLISYSLYLWHWLVFSIVRYEGVTETAWVLINCYVLILILGYLSWRFIEKPTRKFNAIKLQYTACILILAPILFVHLNSYIIKINTGFPQRFNQELVDIYKHLQRYDSPNRPLCISNKHTDPQTQCIIGDKNSANKSFLIGDSFSNHYWGFIDTLGKAAGMAVMAQGTSSCITLPGIYLYDWWTFKNQPYQECFDQTQKYYQMIRENHYKYVFIGQVWENYLGDNIINYLNDKRSPRLNKRRLKIALDKGLKIIINSGAIPILIKSTAYAENNAHHCFFKHVKSHQNYDPSQCDFALKKTVNSQWIDTLFERMQAKYPTLVIIDPKDIQCPNKTCAAALNGVPIYRDIGHITDYASYFMGRAYLKKFGNPLGGASLSLSATKIKSHHFRNSSFIHG